MVSFLRECPGSFHFSFPTYRTSAIVLGMEGDPFQEHHQGCICFFLFRRRSKSDSLPSLGASQLPYLGMGQH